MHQECSHGECHPHKKQWYSGDHHSKSCQCSCCLDKCGCSCHQQECSFPEQLIKMADDAWMEVLKDKIKEQVLKLSEAHLDQIAKIVADANHNRWKHKMETQKSVNDYKEKITGFFSK